MVNIDFQINTKWDAPPEQHDEIVALVREYLANPESPFRNDYSREGWCGLPDVPVVVDVSVKEMKR